MKHKINKILEQDLRLIHPSDSKLTFKELLDQKSYEHTSGQLTRTSHSSIQSKAKYFTRNIKIAIF